MTWHVYILRSLKDGKYYIGSTSNIKQRLERHNAGRNQSTRHRRPFEFICSEAYNTKHEAVAREYKIKSWKGGIALKTYIKEWAGGRADNCTRL